MNWRGLSNRVFGPFERWIDTYTPYDEAATPPKGFRRFLWEYVRPFKVPLIIAGVLSALLAFAEVGLFYYAGRLIDLLNATSPQDFWLTHGFELGIALLAVLLVMPAVSTLETFLLKIAVQPNLAALGRWRAHRHVLRQPVGWFENDFAGRIANRVTSLPATTGEMVLLVMHGIGFFIAYFIAAITMLASAAPILVVPLVFWLVLYISLLWYFLPRVRAASKKSSSARSRTLGFVVDSYSNIQSVKLFDHSRHEADVTKEIFEFHRKTYAAENRVFTLMDGGQIFLNGVLTAGVCGWALWLWTGDHISVGAVATATTLALRINGMTGRIMFMLMNLFRAVGVINEGMETVAQPIGLLDHPDAKELNLTDGKIEFRALTHHYGKMDGGLADVSLVVKPGEKVGLVGRSGAGKTTMVKCLLRLLDSEGGKIMIDGQDIALVTQTSLRREVGVVSQDSSLLHRSIRDNILYGRPDASDEEILAAARQALADDFIPDLEDSFGNKGYDAQVGERGVKLSGGQRQRIALARVILKNAPILVLDEATSALDSAAEAQVQSALYGMMAGKTVLAIAHRLSTIAQMDRIVVLDGGHIVEQGGHAELLAQNGLYAELWRYQSGGYLNAD